jgi:riboflavin kinase / FMN adenylyltransferase
MKILDTTDQTALRGSVVTVGSFDGVHRGHRKLLDLLRQTGNRMGLETALVTFDPVPRAVISPDSAPRLICNVQTRLNLLKLTGCVDHCAVLRFDERMRRESVEYFVVGNLVGRLGMRVLLVGENFACGSGRKGDVSYLSELGLRHGFSVMALPLHAPPGVARCSSTEARRLIEQGEVAAAARLLDRAHEITGVVLDDAGTEQGIRAAIDKDLCTPPNADYAGAFRIENGVRQWRHAKLRICDVASPGSRIVRLTFDGESRARAGDALTMRFAERVAVDA